MMKFNLAVAVAVLASAVVGCYGGDEFFYNEAFFKTETVLPKLDFHRLNEIGQIKAVGLKCHTLEREVRDMLEGEGRDSQSRGAMLSMVAEVIRRKSPTNHASVIANLELCAERAKADGVFAPPANPNPVLMSNLDFRGLVDAVGTSTGDKKCLALEDELREQLGNFSQESTDLLNRVTCYVGGMGTHLAHSTEVYNMLVECLGSNLRTFDPSEEC